MTVLDPNILNPFTLLDPSIAQTVSLSGTIVSFSLSLVISWHFFRSYKFSGLGYLLGLPIGFATIAISFVLENLSLIYANDDVLYPVFFWIQLTLQSEALALIALSYRFKNRSAADYDNYRTKIVVSKQQLHDGNASVRVRQILDDCMPMLMVAIPFIVPISELVFGPDFNHYGLADLSFFIRIYNMIILGYIFSKAVISLVKAANIKLLYIPAAFALLWLEQYSLMIIYFDNSPSAFIGSILARLAGLTLFVYAIRYALAKGRISGDVEIETREET
jgi:hypothetical protein